MFFGPNTRSPRGNPSFSMAAILHFEPASVCHSRLIQGKFWTHRANSLEPHMLTLILYTPWRVAGHFTINSTTNYSSQVGLLRVSEQISSSVQYGGVLLAILKR